VSSGSLARFAQPVTMGPASTEVARGSAVGAAPTFETPTPRLMLSFAVADAPQAPAATAVTSAIRGAYLIGKEDLPVPGSVGTATVGGAGGVAGLSCRKSFAGSAALSVPVECGPLGVLQLRTCLLPDREAPYSLETELARRRIMLLLNKIEEWGWSDLSADDPIMRGLDKSRELFTQALTAPAGSGANAARESLRTALVAGELLAMRDAQRRLMARLADDDRPQVGVAVHADQFAEPLQKVVSATADFVHVPLRWSKIEPEEGRFDFTRKDRWVEWAVRHAKLPVSGGPVIDLTPRGCPEWLHVWNHDYESLREFAYEHAKRVVTRYRRTVSRWVIAGGLNVNHGFTLTVEQMVDLTRVAVMTVRKLHPAAPVFVEISEPFGEHAFSNTQSVAPLLFAELVLGSGVQVDGFALRVQMGEQRSSNGGRWARDMLELSAMLDTYAEFEKPLHVSAIGCPSGPANGTADGGSAGFWRAAWSPESQVSWMEHALLVALSKPQVKSVCWQQLFDTPDGPDMPLGGLVTVDGRAKPALKRLGEITAGLRAKKPVIPRSP